MCRPGSPVANVEPRIYHLRMALLPEQEELLVTLVEAARKVPRHQQQFMHLSFTTD
jgi:hypothetical protein